MKITINDIYGYTIFANIDDRKGNIKGHMVLLSEKQLEMIEDIILNEEPLRVKDEYSYEVEK